MEASVLFHLLVCGLDIACGHFVLKHSDIWSVQAGSAEVVIEEIEISNSGKNPPDCALRTAVEPAP